MRHISAAGTHLQPTMVCVIALEASHVLRQWFADLQMEASLRRELETAAKERDRFVKEFSQQDYDYIVNGWQVSQLVPITSPSMQFSWSELSVCLRCAEKNLHRTARSGFPSVRAAAERPLRAIVDKDRG